MVLWSSNHLSQYPMLVDAGSKALSRLKVCRSTASKGNYGMGLGGCRNKRSCTGKNPVYIWESYDTTGTGENIMKPLLTILIVLAIFASMWAVTAVRISGTNEPGACNTLDKQTCQSLKAGMTYNEVIAEVGSEPLTAEEAESPNGLKVVKPFWRDKHGNFLYLRFVDGTLRDTIDMSFR